MTKKIENLNHTKENEIETKNISSINENTDTKKRFTKKTKHSLKWKSAQKKLKWAIIVFIVGQYETFFYLEWWLAAVIRGKNEQQQEDRKEFGNTPLFRTKFKPILVVCIFIFCLSWKVLMREYFLRKNRFY